MIAESTGILLVCRPIALEFRNRLITVALGIENSFLDCEFASAFDFIDAFQRALAARRLRFGDAYLARGSAFFQMSETRAGLAVDLLAPGALLFAKALHLGF